MKMNLLRGTRSYWLFEGYSQAEVSSIKHNAPVARLEAIKVFLEFTEHIDL